MELEEIQLKIQALARRSTRERTVTGNMVGSAVGSPGQAMRKRLQEMFHSAFPNEDYSRLLVMDVADLTIKGGETGFDVGVSLPVASDIWYLTIGESILPFRGDNFQENADRILGFLADYLTYLDNIKPLKSLQQYADVHSYISWDEMRTIFDADHAPHVIREMRFETWMLNRNTEFPSKGPKNSLEDGVKSKPETSMGQLYGGLLSFPVGPMGVMEVLAIFSETMPAMLENDIPFNPEGTIKIEFPEGWACVLEKPLDGFMSPMTDMKGACPGVHLVEKGYMIMNRDAEYPAEAFAGYDSILPFQSLRYYLSRTAKWPVPGEFIGLLAKPWHSHVWWFQETSPLLYSGNWFETNYYTSGIIKEILQPPEGSFGLVYRCVVRGVEVCIAASDFYGYNVGDRVAIIRINDLGRFTDETKGNFKWKEMEDLIAREKMEKETPSNVPYVVNPNMMILPMSFYQP